MYVLAFPLLPLLPVLAAGWWVWDALRRVPRTARVLSWPGWAWSARMGLAVVFVLSALRLADDFAVLT